MPTALRATLYARVSDDRREGRSVDSQLAEARARAEREQWRVVGEYRDGSISASRYARQKNRPGWQQAMEQITAGETDILSVWELSRASRDRVVSAALLAACSDVGVLLDVGGKLHDPRDADDGFMLDLMSALAVRGSAETSRRVKRDVVARARAGKAHGTHRYGYKTEYDPTTGAPLRRLLDPQRAKIVREIADRLLAGESAYGVAADLNRRGVPTSMGKLWRGGNITKMIRSPTYVARRILNGEDIGPADWPPILTAAEHQLILAMLADPGRDKYRKDTRVKHLGAGVYRCGVCGGRIRVLTDRRKRPGTQQKYSCAVKFCVTRGVRDVDRLIETLLVRRLSSDDVVAALARADTDADVQRAAAEAVELRNELNALYDDVTAKRLTRAALIRMEPSYLTQIENAERRARPRRLPAAVFNVAGPDAERVWKALPISDRRAIVAALLDVRIMRQGRGHWRFNPDTIKTRWLDSQGVPNV